ncbi:hypothetical protein JD844_027341 [Phrynosoma platyrhinos]|uniref:C-type lectin domain-containing protein n=1 Tax=Phrynosoma platyrhinos TaxID=52577 RepID=A0ABQ7SG65_PHRPL|nr:hypothetical protein JD844_027341 [Phrynosoma platyrhinos]
MASEVTYAEVNFIKTPPPADPKASSKPQTPLNVFQRIPSWFPWVMSGFLLLLSIALLIVIFVSPKEWLKKTPHKSLPSNSTEWHCLLKRHGGTEQELSCCKEGWQQFQSRCYRFSKDKDTWSNSKMKCVDMDSNLVVINSETEQEFLINQTGKSFETKNFCIGLIKQEEEGGWQWVDQTPIDPAATFWRDGEPSNGDEDCVVMHIDRYQWNDKKNWNNVRCAQSKHHYICESMAINF